jgi:hypothetical protein
LAGKAAGKLAVAIHRPWALGFREAEYFFLKIDVSFRDKQKNRV